MLNRYAIIAATIVGLLLGFGSPEWAVAQLSCSDLKYGGPNYHEKMDELAERAGLPDNDWTRYHESVVSDFCRGDIAGVDKLIDNGSVPLREVEGIAKALGKAYRPRLRSDAGRRYGESKKRFLEMGACSACADNIAQHYARTPNSSCGRLAKQALEGNADAIKKVVDFPEYCRWKY